jgi:epoxyqueuosine reductase
MEELQKPEQISSPGALPSSQLHQLFEECGLVLVGALPLSSLEREFARFQSWLDADRHGGMVYLKNYPEIRLNPSLLGENLQSVLVFGFPYYLGNGAPCSPLPLISQYAQYKDYHKFMRRKAEQVVVKLEQLIGAKGEFRIAVDSAPVLERALAQRCGQGFIGKNSCYYHRTWGSFILLGEIFTSFLLTEKNPSKPFREPPPECEGCRLCQDACPVGALHEPWQVDGKLCLSYWTIEHRGEIPKRFWRHFKHGIFGCDICQLVCPHNMKVVPRHEGQEFLARPTVDLFEVATMDQKKYEALFGSTPMTRAKIHGLKRNALIALFVRNDPRLDDALRCVTDHDHPVLIKTKEEIMRQQQNASI